MAHESWHSYYQAMYKPKHRSQQEEYAAALYTITVYRKFLNLDDNYENAEYAEAIRMEFKKEYEAYIQMQYSHYPKTPNE